MIEDVFLPGGYLSLWGVALLLVHLSLLRITNLVHIRLAATGRVKPPQHPYAPMPHGRDLLMACAALCSGLAGILAFLSAASHAVPLPAWLTPLTLPPLAEAVRIVLAMCVFCFFVTAVAESPTYKLKWIAAWCLFAFTLTWIT